MKIVFVAGSLGRGGAEKQLFHLCRVLTQHDVQILVISFTSKEHYENEIRSLGIEVYNVKNSKNKLARLTEMYKVVKVFKPDVLYGFHFYTGFYIGIIGKLLKIPSIGSIRSDGIAEKKMNGIFSWVHYALPSVIVANSRNAIDNAMRIFYKKELFLLPNIIDLEYFKFKSKIDNSKLKLLFIGSLKEIKQPNLFVELVHDLYEQGETIEAKIIGSGQLKESLINRSQLLPIEFIEQINDVRSYIYEADYLISTSKFEGTPNVILEAFALGTNVVALYHDGIKDWINKGYLKKLNSIEEMKFTISKREKNDVRTNRLFLENEHSEKKVLHDFVQILSKFKFKESC